MLDNDHSHHNRHQVSSNFAGFEMLGSKPQNGGLTNLQEAFFKTDKLVNSASPAVSIDSVEGHNFNILRQDSVVEEFGQITPETKVLDQAPCDNVKAYGYEQELGFDEPVSRNGSLQLPKFDPSKNYFESYWRLYLKNEQLLSQISMTAEERDVTLKQILQLEQFYNSDESLLKTTGERYQSGRKKHNRRCANEI